MRVGGAEALGLLQKRWGIAAPETLAIGHKGNDREMVGIARAIEEHVLRAQRERGV